jgi:hypothetical protein
MSPGGFADLLIGIPWAPVFELWKTRLSSRRNVYVSALPSRRALSPSTRRRACQPQEVQHIQFWNKFGFFKTEHESCSAQHTATSEQRKPPDKIGAEILAKAKL